VRTLRRVATDLRCLLDGRLDSEAVDTFLVSLELVHRELVAREQISGSDADVDEAYELVRTSVTLLREFQVLSVSHCEGSTPPVLHTGCLGRPRFDMPSEQLQFLVESRFTGPQMAQIIGVSLSTVRRRMTDYGLSVTAQYAELSDEELDDLVREIQHDFPTCGNRQMQGQLLSRGFRVQQHRIREAQRRVDPEGSVMRHLHAVHRRHYRVLAPRSLWHIDGNHKLIRYTM